MMRFLNNSTIRGLCQICCCCCGIPLVHRNRRGRRQHYVPRESQTNHTLDDFEFPDLMDDENLLGEPEYWDFYRHNRNRIPLENSLIVEVVDVDSEMEFSSPAETPDIPEQHRHKQEDCTVMEQEKEDRTEQKNEKEECPNFNQKEYRNKLTQDPNQVGQEEDPNGLGEEEHPIVAGEETEDLTELGQEEEHLTVVGQNTENPPEIDQEISPEVDQDPTVVDQEIENPSELGPESSEVDQDDKTAVGQETKDPPEIGQDPPEVGQEDPPEVDQEDLHEVDQDLSEVVQDEVQSPRMGKRQWTSCPDSTDHYDFYEEQFYKEMNPVDFVRSDWVVVSHSRSESSDSTMQRAKSSESFDLSLRAESSESSDLSLSSEYELPDRMPMSSTSEVLDNKLNLMLEADATRQDEVESGTGSNVGQIFNNMFSSAWKSLKRPKQRSQTDVSENYPEVSGNSLEPDGGTEQLGKINAKRKMKRAMTP